MPPEFDISTDHSNHGRAVPRCYTWDCRSIEIVSISVRSRSRHSGLPVLPSRRRRSGHIITQQSDLHDNDPHFEHMAIITSSCRFGRFGKRAILAPPMVAEFGRTGSSAARRARRSQPAHPGHAALARRSRARGSGSAGTPRGNVAGWQSWGVVAVVTLGSGGFPLPHFPGRPEPVNPSPSR